MKRLPGDRRKDVLDRQHKISAVEAAPREKWPDTFGDRRYSPEITPKLRVEMEDYFRDIAEDGILEAFLERWTSHRHYGAGNGWKRR